MNLRLEKHHDDLVFAERQREAAMVLKQAIDVIQRASDVTQKNGE